MIVAGSQTVCEGNIIHLWLAKVGLAARGNLILVMLILVFSHLFDLIFFFFVSWFCEECCLILHLISTASPSYCGHPRRWNSLSGSLFIEAPLLYQPDVSSVNNSSIFTTWPAHCSCIFCVTGAPLVALESTGIF